MTSLLKFWTLWCLIAGECFTAKPIYNLQVEILGRLGYHLVRHESQSDSPAWPLEFPTGNLIVGCLPGLWIYSTILKTQCGIKRTHLSKELGQRTTIIGGRLWIYSTIKRTIFPFFPKNLGHFQLLRPLATWAGCLGELLGDLQHDEAPGGPRAAVRPGGVRHRRRHRGHRHGARGGTGTGWTAGAEGTLSAQALRKLVAQVTLLGKIAGK